MEHSIGEGYVSQVVSQQVGHQDDPSEAAGDSVDPEDLVTVAGDVALANLAKILLEVNGVMLIAIPLLAWVLTGRALAPIENMYEKQQRFVSDASHELRTPLTIMLGELELALKKKRKPNEYIKAISSTRDEVLNLQNLTNSLLIIARSGDNAHELEVVDVTDILHEVIAKIQPQIKKRHQKLDFSITPHSKSENSMLANGSPILLRQLFLNVLDNANKFTPTGGYVHINLSSNDKVIRIEIEDSGTGMSKSETDQVFERFYRADKSRQKHGFGLGLAFCKSVAELHHGSILLSSVPRKGTTVTITLPKKS